MRILIVEDEDFSRQMLRGFLEKLGHQPVAVSSGQEAWRLFQEEPFSMVITDWMMPGLDGLDLVRRIRAVKGAAYVYIILLTAKSGAVDVVEGLSEGADDFLSKPYDSDELRVRIRAGERVVQLEEGLMARNEELAAAKLALEATNADLERANLRMKKDLDAAATIQQSLLPPVSPPVTGLLCEWIYRPCDELAGDIFNVFDLGEKHVGFYVLDVVGHGVPAALLSVTLSRFLSPTSGSSSVLFKPGDAARLQRPSEVATELNTKFPMSEKTGQYFTLVLGLLNLETRELQFTAAGHPGPIHVPLGGRPTALDISAFPVGFTEDPAYRDEVMTLNPGDHLVLYTDGLVDAENVDGHQFGKGRLLELSGSTQSTLQATVRAIDAELVRWCAGQRQRDDISMLALSIH